MKKRHNRQMTELTNRTWERAGPRGNARALKTMLPKGRPNQTILSAVDGRISAISSYKTTVFQRVFSAM